MKLIRFLLVLLIWGVSIAPVFAQSQQDINPEFNPSSEDLAYIRLNYDCSNTAHFLESGSIVVINIYRKLVADGEGFRINTYAVFGDRNNKGLYESQFLSFVRRVENEPGTIPNIAAYEADPNIVTTSPGILLNSPFIHPSTGEVVCEKPVNTQIEEAQIIEYPNPDGGPPLNLRESITAQLIPPTLQVIENYFLQGVYVFWAFLGVYSLYSFWKIWSKYIISWGNKVRNEEVVTAMMQWVVSLLVAILSIPTLNFAYDILNLNTTECFYYNDPDDQSETPVYDLTVPGFTFFFKDVCTGDFAIDNT